MLDKRAFVLALPMLLAAGCMEDITVVPGPGQLTMAVFDVTTDPVQVPIPTDLVTDPATGLLDIPPADPTQEPAQAYLDGYLNTLNGWPGIIPAEVRFTGPLDKATVNERNIVVLELDPNDPTKVTPVTGQQYEYKEETGGGSVVRIYPPGMSWSRGARYVIYVIGGPKGLKATTGDKQVYRMPYFELAAASSPLCAWDKTRSWDSATMSCAAPSGGAPATGCCTFNYNGVLASATKDEVRHDPNNADLSLEEVEALAAKTVLERVTRFELMRQSFNQVLGMTAQSGVNRDDIAVLWTFKVLDMNEAIFNPTVTPPQVPTPSDLVKDRQTGLLALPIDPTSSKAEQALTAYLNTLDGWPVGFPGAVSFTDDIDTTSTAGGALAFAIDRSGSTPKATKLDKTFMSYDGTKKQLAVFRKGGFPHATTIVVVAVGGAGGLKNKDATVAASPIRSPFMHVALSPHPLCASFDATAGTCGGDPTMNVFSDDPDFVQGGLTAKQKAALFEAVRLGYAPLLKAVLAADSSLKEEDVRSLWSFTTTSMTMINVDPGTGAIPFPSDFILDSETGKVSIPASPGETPGEAALRQGLNTMDGFTTQGTSFVPVAGKLDPASLKAQFAVLTLNVSTAIPAAAAMTVTADNTAGALTFKPDAPLPEKTQFAYILTSKRKAGSNAAEGGLTDDKGNAVVPSPTTVLLRGVDPVYDEAAKKSLVSSIDDATAKVLEKARQEAAPTFDGLKLFGLAREDIVGMWATTTMGSITKEMMQLRALPYQALAADQNKPKLVGALDKALSTWPTTYMNTPKTNIGGIVASGTYKSFWAIDPATDTFTADSLSTKGKVVDVPFLLTVPTGAMPATGWPLVIYVQSVYQSKKEALSIVSANAQKGMATITFDLPFHGERSWCLKDEECDAGGTCDKTTGVCSTKLADKDGNGIIDASGNDKFVNLQNPFAIRDNLRQAVIDASALLRAVLLGGASGITGGPVAFDPTKITVAGYSTGALVATDWLAVEGNVTRGALNSPPIRFAEIFFGPDAGKDWDNIKQATFQAQGITEGTLDAIRLVTTFQWIMEPADPGNFARHVSKVPLDDLLKPGSKVPAKQILTQQAEKDEGVPVRFSDDLLTAMGITDSSKTLYLGQAHRMFKLGDPDLTATQACRTQMATFLSAGTVCTPAVAGGKYTGQCN